MDAFAPLDQGVFGSLIKHSQQEPVCVQLSWVNICWVTSSVTSYMHVLALVFSSM